ncbi:MAG TPA: TonB family protein [Bryobacteraceae bacterium]|nr:TonB family protein [Bryobacteraceae bacterium]
MKRAVISLLFLIFSVAFGQDSPEARSILDKVAQASKSGRSYRAEFSGSAEKNGAKIALAGTAIYQPPGKVHTEWKMGPTETWTIGDGAQTWTYLPGTKQYRRTAASAREDAGSPDPSMFLGGLAKALTSARRAPDEDVTLDGSAVRCYVIAADFENRQGPAGPIHFTLWVDRTNYVILRAKGSGAGQGTVEVMINKLVWEPALTGKEFVFVIPEGATEIASPTKANVSGTIQAATLIKRVSPEYPADAKAARIQGTVRFRALLGKDGTVKDLQLLSGHPMLVQAARDAVKQWVYRPTLLNGEPVEVQTQIDMNFRLETPETPAGAYRIGNGVSAPRVAYKREPSYSEEARIGRLQGTVTVSLVVGEDGMPRNIRVLKSLGLGLDEKAIEAIGVWRFTPGEKEGKPVPILATIEVNFRLVDKVFDNVGQWHLTRASFKPPEEASLPSLIKAKFPHDSSSEDGGSVVVALDVDERGLPVNIHVEKSSDAKWEEEVVAAAREWRFTPGENGGAAVVVPLTLEFSFAPKKPQ